MVLSAKYNFRVRGATQPNRIEARLFEKAGLLVHSNFRRCNFKAAY